MRMAVHTFGCPVLPVLLHPRAGLLAARLGRVERLLAQSPGTHVDIDKTVSVSRNRPARVRSKMSECLKFCGVLLAASCERRIHAYAYSSYTCSMHNMYMCMYM
jgi:hypothetical protein